MIMLCYPSEAYKEKNRYSNEYVYENRMESLNINECFVKLNEEQRALDYNLLDEIAKYQKLTGELDTDKIINRIRDGRAGYELGYTLVDISKGGWDCASEFKRVLEVKSINIDAAKGWNATFNDTTTRKAELFKDKDVYLAVALWGLANELHGIVVGNNPEIGKYLRDRVDKFMRGEAGIRSTQSISVSTLINKYGFDIVAIDSSREDLYKILKKKYPKLKIDSNNIYTKEEYYDRD